MGKNQTYKAMQRARVGSSSASEEIDDGMVDGSFHSPEWHAARLASLKTSHTVTWEEFKRKQKEDEVRLGELEADKDRMMKEYRAQLDAERAHKLARGAACTEQKNTKKKHTKKRRKHSRYSSSSSDESEERERRPRREKKSVRRREEEHSGPMPLSRFFHNPND